MATELVTFNERNGIGLLTLSKPPVNAIDLELCLSMKNALEQAMDSADLRALVFTGTDKSFSAGLDLKRVAQYEPAEQRDMVQAINELISRLYGLPIPVVGAINGHAIAGGLCLALACDYRVGPVGSSKFGLTEARAGIPFPAAPLAIVKAELAPQHVRTLCLTTRNVGPEDALHMGILDELAEPNELASRATAVAEELAAISKEGYASVKRQVRAETLAYLDRLVSESSDPMIGQWLVSGVGQASASLLKSAKERT